VEATGPPAPEGGEKLAVVGCEVVGVSYFVKEESGERKVKVEK
jgi:hypothetical protein